MQKYGRFQTNIKLFTLFFSTLCQTELIRAKTHIHCAAPPVYCPAAICQLDLMTNPPNYNLSHQMALGWCHGLPIADEHPVHLCVWMLTRYWLNNFNISASSSAALVPRWTGQQAPAAGVGQISQHKTKLMQDFCHASRCVPNFPLRCLRSRSVSVLVLCQLIIPKDEQISCSRGQLKLSKPRFERNWMTNDIKGSAHFKKQD